MKGQCQLPGSEHRLVVLWVDSGIVTIPLFRIDVPLSSKCIGFHAKFSGTDMYNEVEGRKKFQPMCQLTCEDSGGGKVLKVPVVSNNIDWCTRTLEIMSPTCEGFNNCE